MSCCICATSERKKSDYLIGALHGNQDGEVIQNEQRRGDCGAKMDKGGDTE